MSPDGSRTLPNGQVELRAYGDETQLVPSPLNTPALPCVISSFNSTSSLSTNLEDAVLATLENWLWQGPKLAKVINVAKHALTYQDFPDFSIRH